MCLPPAWHNCVSSPELPSAHCACTDYRLVWLNECTCVYIFYICTVYIYSVYVYIGVYYVYRHVATYPNSPYVLKRIYVRVTKENWGGYSKILQQDGFATILTPFSFGCIWLKKAMKLNVHFVPGKVPDKKVLTEWHCSVFSRARKLEDSLS